jgi:hypothetical protein
VAPEVAAARAELQSQPLVAEDLAEEAAADDDDAAEDDDADADVDVEPDDSEEKGN